MVGWITIGTCGCCGGAVRTPAMWHSVMPPPTQCEKCGAEPAAHGPVLPMQPRRSGYRQETTDDLSMPNTTTTTTTTDFPITLRVT